MKTLCRYCVKKPVTVLMAVLIIIVFGIFSLTRMSLALFPNLNLPYAVIVTTYVGANPEQVEKDVSIPIEQQCLTLTNYHALTSYSNEHYSMIMVEFEDNTNMDNAFLEMRENIDSISFPSGVGKPRIMRLTADMMPIVTVHVAKGDEDLTETTRWVKNELDAELVKIDGVAQISYSGTADVVVKAKIDDTKLALKTNNTLTKDDLLRIVDDTNDTTGLIGITVDTDGIKMLYIGDPTENIKELEELPIYYDGSNIITFKDVLVDDTAITFGNNDTSSYNRINGKEGITISFQQDSSAELTTVVKNIKKAFKDIQKDNPDVKIVYILDQGEYVETSIGTVVDNLVQGALLAVIILLIFLLSIKPTLIVAISIPVSVIATFVAMYFAGINLNIVSMGGLALGIGMLVDNSVVVIENIFRMIKNGKTKKEAAVLGAAEVAGAITASTLTTLAVFIPIMFLKGLAGSIFREMALTVCFSLGCSLIIALTVVPSFAAKFLTDKEDTVKETKLKKLSEKINSNKKVGYTVTGLVIALIGVSAALIVKFAFKLNIVYAILIGLVIASFMIVALISSIGKIENKEGKITKTYEKAIRWSINHKTIVLLSSIALLVVSAILSVSRGFALIPATDEGSISGTITLDGKKVDEATIQSYATSITNEIIENTSDIETIQTTTGSGSLLSTILGQSSSGSSISLTIALKDDRSKTTKEIRKNIEKLVNAYIDENYNRDEFLDVEFKEASSMASMLGTSGTQIYVEGSDLSKSAVVAERLAEIIGEVEGIEKPDSGVSQGNKTVKIEVKRNEAIKYGLYSKDYSNAVSLFYKDFGFSMDTAGQETLKVNVDGILYEFSTTSSGSLNTYGSLGLSRTQFLNSIAVFDNNMYELLSSYNGSSSIYVMSDGLQYEMYKLIMVGINPNGDVDPKTFTPEQIQAYTEFMTNIKSLPIVFQLNKNIIYDEVNGIIREVNLADTDAYGVRADGITVYDKVFDTDLGTMISEYAKTYINDETTTIKEEPGFSTINRNGKDKYILVTAQLKDGYNATKVGSKVTEAVNKYLKSDEFAPYKNIVKVYEQGENEQIMDVVKQLVICAVVGILLVYMIMSIQFQSLKYPLIIMGTIPLAFTGGFILLFVCGMELSMVALIGLVVLVGVVVNNGIVIVDYMNQLVEDGMPVKEAAVVAGKTRLRPIFMTALTTIFALLTMALGFGESAEIMQPLAVAAIGGLTYATILTLLVVPSLYVMMSRRKIKKEEANNTNSEINESENNGEITSN